MSDEAEPVSAGNPFPQTDPLRSEPERFAAADGYEARRWSAEEPKAAGWWWHRWREDSHEAWSPAEVLRVEDGACAFGETGLHVETVPIDLLYEEQWQEWAGPLPEPLDAPNVEPPHIDLKLSERGARRGTCAAGGEGGGPEAGAVTCGTVRCSAWLGVTFWVEPSANWKPKA